MMYTPSTGTVIPSWYNEERNYRENYTLGNAKDFFKIYFKYSVQHWIWPKLCIMCCFGNPFVFPEPKIGWECQIMTFSFHPLCSDKFVPLPTWSLGLCSPGASSQQRVCHGSGKQADGGSRSPSISTSHMSMREDASLLINTMYSALSAGKCL